jgi:hypothetical protein
MSPQNVGLDGPHTTRQATLLAAYDKCLVLCDRSTGVPLLHYTFIHVSSGLHKLHIPIPRETPEPAVQAVFKPSGCSCIIRIGQYLYLFELKERECELALLDTRHVPDAPEGTCIGFGDDGKFAIGTGDGRVYVYENFRSTKPIADFSTGASPVTEIALHDKAIFAFLLSGDMWEGTLKK